jgi:hypothetical protein
MNIIQGLNLKGFQLQVAENFSSVPGLMSYWHGLFRKEFDVSSNIATWGDLSTQNNVALNATISQRPNFTSPYINLGQNKSLKSIRRNFNFLHNGSAFGVYSIVKVDLSQMGSAFTVLETSLGNFTGLSFSCGSGTNGRIVLAVRNGATQVRLVLLTNLLNTYPTEALVIVRHVFKGEGVSNNHILSYGNVSGVVTNAGTGYATGDHNAFTVTGNPNTSLLKLGATLIYDFTGLSSAAIDTRDAKIVSLLTTLKNEFDAID